MIISLTPDLEIALTEQARRQETTPEQLALETLRERFPPSAPSTGEAQAQDTLAEYLSGCIGVLHSGEHVPGGARMSEDCGSKFAAVLTKQRQQRPQ